MTALTEHLDHYLTVRRSLGYGLATSERMLRGFAAFAEAEGADHVTVELFLRWKERFGSANNNTWSARLGAVRIFATWLQGIDPRTEVPPAGLIVGRRHRPRPFIYSKVQIEEMVATARRLPSAYGLRGWTCSTLFGLIAVTGLRVSEAIGLDGEDIDLAEAALTIRKGKNGKPRFVPISACTAEQLRAYRSERNRLPGGNPSPFFLCEGGRRPTDCGTR